MEKDHTKKKKRWIKTRRQKYLFLSSITTVLILVAIVLVNVLTVYITDRYPVTIDLTPEKVFQLTDQSKEYIENLSAPVSIQVMTSEENFMASGEYYVQAHSVIEQYEKYSDQITLEYVDLLENPSLASAYEDVQIGDIIVSSGNRSQTLTAYDLFNVESGSYYGNYITSSRAEQAMTSAIMNVTSETQVKAGVLTGHSEQYPDGFVQLLENNNFEVVSVSPATEEIPEDIDVLIWVARFGIKSSNNTSREVLSPSQRLRQSLTERILCSTAETSSSSRSERLEPFSAFFKAASQFFSLCKAGEVYLALSI